MAEFRIDIILNSLKELEQEKRRLENRLNSERSKRKDLEEKAELINSRYKQINEKYNKMLDTRNVARRRVSETQSQVDRLQRIHEQKQQSITELKRKIQDEKEQQQRNLESFEGELNNIRDEIVNAFKRNSDSALENETLNLQETLTGNRKIAGDHRTTLTELSTCLEKSLALNADVSKNVQDVKQPWEDVKEDDLLQFVCMVTKENELAKEKLVGVNDALTAQKECLSNVTKKIPTSCIQLEE